MGITLPVILKIENSAIFEVLNSYTNFIFWKLIDLIEDIQNELDKCWAILGEKYGKDEIRPLLKYRRVISNLQEKSYFDTLSFVPEKILFGSDSDLAKLLVEPLYGNNPTYGVRELLQNSIDALHERIFLENLAHDFDSLIEINILHDSNEEYFFEIRDNGKGMNIKEIKNYFLKAGATNRKSKEWDDLYLDSERSPRVLKSGKFGVGILAAFLIGDELEVKTRRFDSVTGLFFKANINSRDIEVTKMQDLPVGTTIKIKIKSEGLEYFKTSPTQLVAWDKWYTLNKPRIKYNCLIGFNKKYGNEEFDPSYFESNNNWIEFSSNGYSKLRWSYIEKRMSYNSKYQLTCNGLVIPSPPKIYSGSIPPPHIQVFDFDGILPINLSRNTLDSNYLPFEKDLISSVFKCILIELLKTDPHIAIYSNKVSLSSSHYYPKLFGGIKTEEFYNGLAYTSEGYYLKNSYLSEFLKGKKVIRLSILNNDNLKELCLRVDHSYILEIVRVNNRGLKIQGYADIETKKKMIEWAIFPSSNADYEWFEKDSDYDIDKKQIYSKEFITVKRNDLKKIPFYFGSMSELELDCLQSIICFSTIRYALAVMNSEFNKYLSRIFNDLGDPVIPYDEESRKSKIKKIIDLA